MFDVIQFWWVAHPIAREAVFPLIIGILVLFLTPLLSPVVETFWRLWAIPPQRLSTWVLRVRLSNAEWRLYRLLRLRSDMRYFAFTCFMGLTSLLMSTSFLVLSYISIAIAETGISEISVRIATKCVYIFSLLACLFLLQCTSKMIALGEAVSRPTEAKAKISSRIETLQEKLRLKGEACEGVALGGPETDRPSRALQGAQQTAARVMLDMKARPSGGPSHDEGPPNPKA